MSVYLITGGKNKERLLQVQAMLKELLATEEFEKLVDYKLIDIEEGKKNISIDQIRNVEDFIVTKPIEKALKVIFIKNADKLSVEAQNAMLKTLEEPPAFVKFILETSRKRSLLPTIISRCINIDIGESEKVDVETNDHSLYVDDFIYILKKDLGGRFDWVSEKKDVFKETDIFINLLNSWESVLRDIVVINIIDKAGVKNKYKIREIEELKKEFKDVVELENCVRQLLRAKAAAQSNVNKSLIIENLLVALPQIK